MQLPGQHKGTVTCGFDQENPGVTGYRGMHTSWLMSRDSTAVKLLRRQAHQNIQLKSQLKFALFLLPIAHYKSRRRLTMQWSCKGAIDIAATARASATSL
jgi:hypothetical protein